MRKELRVGDKVRFRGPIARSDILESGYAYSPTLVQIDGSEPNEADLWVSCLSGPAWKGRIYRRQITHRIVKKQKAVHVLVTRESLAKAWDTMDREKIGVDFKVHSGNSKTFRQLCIHVGLPEQKEEK